MRRMLDRRRSRACLLSAGLLCGLSCGLGCQTTRSHPAAGSAFIGQGASSSNPNENRIDSTRIETRDDIVQIVSFWNQPYWLQDSERVHGFKTTVYFVSGETEKGAFVPGPIDVWVYELVPVGRGRNERKLAFGRRFSATEAVALRVNKLAVGGYYYGMIIQWPRDLYLEGKQVEIQLGYERQGDKQVILSSPRNFQVPIPINFVPPDK